MGVVMEEKMLLLLLLFSLIEQCLTKRRPMVTQLEEQNN